MHWLLAVSFILLNTGRVALGEITHHSKQVQAINAALARRSNLFVDAWDKNKAAGKLQVTVDKVQEKIRKPILAATNGSIDPKELDTLVSRIEAALVDQLKTTTAQQYFDDYYAGMKVTGFFDLADPALPPDLVSVVDYFRKEYGQDVRSARLVLVTGLPLGLVGKHLGRVVGGVSAELGLTVAGAINLSAPVNVSSLDAVVEQVFVDIFGSKDVLLVDSEVFKKLRPDSLNIVAHELRHMLDHNSNDASQANFFKQQAELEKELRVKRAAWIQAEQAAIKESPQTTQHLATFATKLRKKGANELEIHTQVAKELKRLQETGADGVVSLFVYRSNEFERRGYLEQARFAKVAQGWSRDRYLRSITMDIPRVLAPNFTLDPTPPGEFNFHGDLYDSNVRVQVQK
jgi:hypothetical protein